MQSATVRGYPAATAASRFLYGAVAARSSRSPRPTAGASASADPIDCTGPGARCVHALSSAAAPITRETSRNVGRNRYLGVRVPTGSDGQRSDRRNLNFRLTPTVGGTWFARTPRPLFRTLRPRRIWRSSGSARRSSGERVVIESADRTAVATYRGTYGTTVSLPAPPLITSTNVQVPATSGLNTNVSPA